MMTDNPYHPPQSAAATPPGPKYLVATGLTVLAFAAAGGVIGLGIGVFLASVAPNYYRTVLASGGDPGFDPMAAGVGLGLTQGFVGGGAVGLALVAIYYWYRSRVVRLPLDATVTKAPLE